MTNETRLQAANGNAPIMAGAFATLDDRRAWLKSLPNPPKQRKGSRIERAFLNEAREQSDPSRQAAALHHVATLHRIRELMRPADTATTVDIEGDDEDDETNTGFGAELVHNQGAFTPSIPKLITAWADGMRTRVVSKNGKIVGRVCTSYYSDRGGETVTIGGRLPDGFHGLQFYRGELVAFGDKGRKLPPKYVADPKGLSYEKDSETEKHVERQPSEDQAYLNLPGTAPYMPSTMPDAPRSMVPQRQTRRAAKAAAMLAAAANDNAPVTYCPDGVATGYGRLAGICEPAGPGATTAPRHAALEEQERAETFASLDIHGRDLDVIEAVLANESFREIGLRRGYAESSAHKSGRQVVERAFKIISEKIAA